MKKFGWCYPLILCCLILFFTAPASADSNDFSYSHLEEGGIIITGYSGNETDVIVPATIDGYEVKSIGMYAFNETLTSSITIPEGVKSISALAFARKRFLGEVILPSSIETIEASAFDECLNLKNIRISADHPRYAFKDGALYDKLENTLLFFAPSYTQGGSAAIPNGIAHIEDAAFRGCTQLTSITIPEGVVSIGAEAFAGCTSLCDIRLPESLVSIGNKAFANCPLDSITLPACLETIGNHAFYGCPFSSVAIPESTSSIGENPFLACPNLTKMIVSPNNSCFYIDDYGALIDKEQKELICYPQASEQEIYVLPEETYSIAPYAFAYCDSIKKVELPESLAYIYHDAFLKCSSLQHIAFPFQMRSIGDYAFSDCTNLKTLLFMSGDTQIGRNAFEFYNIARIYAMPSSQAALYASRYSIPFTPFVEGTVWQSTSSADEFHFLSDGRVQMPMGGLSVAEGSYWIDENGGEVGFYLNQRYRAESIRFDENKLHTGMGYTFECVSSAGPDIAPDTYPFYHQNLPLAGTRWIHRFDKTQIQFVDDTTYEMLRPDNTLIGRDTYTLNGTEILWPALTRENMHANLAESSLVISVNGKYYSISFDCVGVYDYAGEIQPVLVPTATPEPTPEPTATPIASKPPLTKEDIVGSWGDGTYHFYADGTASHHGFKGYYSIRSDKVILTYYHSGVDEEFRIYLDWNSDGTLSDDPFTYEKD